MEQEIKTLGDALPAEIARVNEIIAEYKSIGPPGMLAAGLMTVAVNKAVKSLASGDVIEMLRCYEDLKGYEL